MKKYASWIIRGLTGFNIPFDLTGWVRSAHFGRQNRKSAFTLAEVLITLTIIGVVAAITVPAVVAKNQKAEFVAGLQKNYNVLNNVIALSQAENGPLDTWPWAGANTPEAKNIFYQTYLIPYLKILKDCNTTTNQNCWTPPPLKYLRLDGAWGDYNTSSDRYKFQLADGSFWLVYTVPTCITSPKYCVNITVDVNGPKGPNTVGRDVFEMRIYPFTNNVALNGTFNVPYDKETNSWATYDDASLLSECDSSNSSSKGLTCAARIQREGWRMNY